MENQTPLPEDKHDEIIQRIKQWNRDNPKATLTEIEEAVDAELSKLRRHLVEGITEGRPARTQSEANCPNCRANMVRNGQKKRVLRSKGSEKLTLNRQQMRCLECGMTLFPPG
jgi:hypothetical protein